MGITKILFLIIALWVAWVLYRRYLQYKNHTHTKQGSSSENTDIKTVKRCEVCGTHVLESDAIKSNNRYYCSKAHFDQDNS